MLPACACVCVCVCPKFKHPCGKGPMQPSFWAGMNHQAAGKGGGGVAVRRGVRPTPLYHTGEPVGEKSGRGAHPSPSPGWHLCKVDPPVYPPPPPPSPPPPPGREPHPSSAGAALNFNSGYQVWPFKLLSQTFFIFFSLSSQALIALRVSAGVRMMF